MCCVTECPWPTQLGVMVPEQAVEAGVGGGGKPHPCRLRSLRFQGFEHTRLHQVLCPSGGTVHVPNIVCFLFFLSREVLGRSYKEERPESHHSIQ